MKKLALALRIGTASCSLALLAGCAAIHRTEALRQAGGNAALVGQFRACDGATGRTIAFDEIARRAARADVVLFGEEHSNLVCNALEAQLLAAMSAQSRPVTLAMEFFEADTQVPLDAYLAGRLNEVEFRKLTRQKRAYLTAHRPMIEYCRLTGIPVIAANAPWRLMRALRLSGLPYEEFRATLDPADRALLPLTSELLKGPYYDHFVEQMAEHMKAVPTTTQPTTQPASQPASTPASQPASQPTSKPADPLLSSYRSQSLWDDTMAMSVAEHRAVHPNRRVLLVVGSFHVAHEGGTQVKVRKMRPNDHILTIVFRGTSETPLSFDEADRAAADIVIYGVTPPEEDAMSMPVPTTAPAPTTTSAPTTQPSH